MTTQKRHPPKRLQGILWSHDVKDLNIEEDKYYIIHQILRYGTVEELNWLFQTYAEHTIQDIFTNHPAKIYSPSSFHFIKQYVLPLSEIDLVTNRYVENTPRYIQS
ncbi:MAG: hypothetical protein US54_C0035G0007 [Candidatus Roizmanbacteria bacterium GW2011_GWA2_37_7]|uniref:DUF6922 domain-containing protein n=1 Tax=Candidatus Roizmanbacteria bacterium GW2011_GWA2_37_7 TaxID=1618481 RepID=A0A0G0HFW2_9BACT|nr:MAG: hypothetical protein US54_C0035G0007 [Candidatus Roizmanbacteria bacterium GW2011_GWA2_37_7]